MDKCFVLELGESARDCAGTVRLSLKNFGTENRRT